MKNNTFNKFNDLCIYQIYIRSFFDSNNDGIGDLNGIVLKLDYLKDLGINAIWLSPCYKSPNDDNGYDISDYRDIMDEFGNKKNWKNMVNEMHNRGIKLIMDFVANHTSSEHIWFKESRKNKHNKYRDYYYWADKPLNNWKSAFGGSAWQYDNVTNQYYLHSFAKSQPDLNWENPIVRKEMKSIIDYWINLGVDGFRCDVLDLISKDFKKNLNGNGPKIHKYIKGLFGRENTQNIFTVGECWGANFNNIKLLCGNKRKELSTVFQFEHICLDRTSRFETKPYNFTMLKDALVKWQYFMQDNNLLYSIFTENHDQPRMISRYGDIENYRFEIATMISVMFYLLKGIPFIYQGQEIGVTNSFYDDISHFNDIETINYYNSIKNKMDEKELIDRINFGSRDNARRPMPWNEEKYGGFSKNKPWITIYDKYKTINVKKDINEKKSIYKFYSNLISIRKNNKAITLGKFEDITNENKDCFIYKRTFKNEEIIAVCNFDNENKIKIDNITDYNIILNNYFYTENDLNKIYKPYEICVFLKNTKQN